MQNRHKTPIPTEIVLTLMTTEIAEAFGYRDRILGIDDTLDRFPRGRRGQHLRRAYRRGYAAADHFSLDVMSKFHLDNYWLYSNRIDAERIEVDRLSAGM